MIEMKGKKALITGASSGIGRATAIRLAEMGVRVLIHYHKQTGEAQAVADLITNGGGYAEILQADLADATEAMQLGDRAWQKLNGFDFLINNAGVSYKKHFLDTTIEDIDHFIDINFKGTLLLTQRVAQKMIDSSTQGSIYTITSINGLQPGVGLSVYGATKGALETLMKGVALELAPHNINVNTFAVGAIQTDMNADTWQDKEKLALVTSNIPLGRLGQPEEIAGVICNLLSAGSYMTGATITIDGGWTLKHGYSNAKPYTKT
jgi:NAD(P)-dependent dehydrogenase (short-subunit alcohol dehydrogenase family)